jgi:lipoprotein-anchoring transpeptidase ErfK/SrfK
MWPKSVENVFEAQVALSRLHFSPGSLDALWGPRTQNALMAFQAQQGLQATGSLDPPTRSRLLLDAEVLAPYTLTSNEITGLRRLGRTWLEKSEQASLAYESVRELLGELGRCSPDLIERLNPGVDWSRVKDGTTLQVPHFPEGKPVEKAAFARLRLAAKTLQVFGEATNIVAHFPVSVARFADKRPAGQLQVAVIIPDPNYTFDPQNFPGSVEGRRLARKLVIRPGPNNPVGKVWIGLDREGYGIHGTPSPETVGRAESAGCFRLTNWDAEDFVRFAWIGMPVLVEP